MKHPEYQIGAKWRVERDHQAFTFVIIGPGSRPGYKLCRVEYDRESWDLKNFETEYSHNHLKSHAIYKPQT
jgi:hypothetical protein